jgi:hypothetical protein
MSGITYTHDLESTSNTFNVSNCRVNVISDIPNFTAGS